MVTKNFDSYMDYVKQVGRPNYGLKLLEAPEEVKSYFDELFYESSDPTNPDDLYRFGYEVLDSDGIGHYVNLEDLRTEYKERWEEDFEGDDDELVEEFKEDIWRELEGSNLLVIHYEDYTFHVLQPF